MSISGVGASASASQMLASLLSRLSSSTSATASTSTSGDTSSTASSGTTSSTTDNTVTGTGKASLSSQILMTLMHMQDDSNSSQNATGTQDSDPLQNLFSAMDTDGDGTVSQSEMESTIQNAGGTTDQADQLYTMLGGTDSSGISKDQLASNLPPPPPGGGHHGPHGGHGPGGPGGPGGMDGADGTDDSSSSGDAIVSALDTNGDGTVSLDELTSFVTANGGTSDDASNEFNALDTSGSGSLSSADFATAWQNLQNSSAGSNAMLSSLLSAFTSANTQASSTTSVSA